MPIGERPGPPRPQRAGRPRRARAHGLALVFLLAWVAILGAAAAHALQLGAAHTRRQAEAELLAVGAEFEAALRSHGEPPRSLQDLLRDPRVGGVRRHLRRLYPDPLSGRSEWGLLRDAQGGIVGVYSLAGGEPLRRSGFASHQAHFAQARRYSDWVFSPQRGAGPCGPQSLRICSTSERNSRRYSTDTTTPVASTITSGETNQPSSAKEK